MIDEKDSDRLQRVVDSMSDNYELKKPKDSLQPEIFWAEPKILSLKEYNQTMDMLLYLSQHQNLIRRILNKNDKETN